MLQLRRPHKTTWEIVTGGILLVLSVFVSIVGTWTAI
jgi:hypothetical protein